MSCSLVVSGNDLAVGSSIWKFSRSRPRSKCAPPRPTTPCSSSMHSAKSDMMPLFVPSVERGGDSGVLGGIGRAGSGRGGRGFSIEAVIFEGAPGCWDRFCCCLYRSDNDSEVPILLGSGSVMRPAPSVSAMSSNITCMGAMYATRFFEHQARTCPQTRPWSLSMTQAPESPPTLCVMSVSVTFESGPPDCRKELPLLTAKVADDVPG